MAAKLKSVFPAFVNRLRDELRRRLLKEAGISSRVAIEAVPGTKVFRIYVIASGFAELGHTERQDLAWRIAHTVLQPEEELRVIILTFSSDEAEGMRVPPGANRPSNARHG